MGDGQAQRVGGIGARQAGQLQQPAHHLLHLGLGRAAMAHDGLLHLQRGVFGHGQPAGHQGGDAGAARLAEQQGGLGVHVHEDDLDRGHVRLVARGHLGDAVEQDLQAARQVAQGRARGADGAAGHVAQMVAVHVHHAEAGGLQAGIDAQDSHGMPFTGRSTSGPNERTRGPRSTARPRGPAGRPPRWWTGPAGPSWSRRGRA